MRSDPDHALQRLNDRKAVVDLLHHYRQAARELKADAGGAPRRHPQAEARAFAAGEPRRR